MSNTPIYEAKLKAQRWIEPLMLGPKDATQLTRDMRAVVAGIEAASKEIARLKKSNAALRDKRRVIKAPSNRKLDVVSAAQQIADVAGESAVDVFRTPTGGVRWVAAGRKVPTDAMFIGRYDEGADWRSIAEDLRA